MGKSRYKHMEDYRGHKIFISGVGREWWWKAVVYNKAKNSATSYFSVQSALNKEKNLLMIKLFRK